MPLPHLAYDSISPPANKPRAIPLRYAVMLQTSAGLIHDPIEYRRSENIFPSILGSFGNRRIENNDYEMVIHGFLSIIL